LASVAGLLVRANLCAPGCAHVESASLHPCERERGSGRNDVALVEGPRTVEKDHVVRRAPMRALDTMFDERDVVADAARHWWMFLLTGIAWLVFALLLFQWDYTTVYAVSFLFGVAVLFAGVNEFGQTAVSTSGWKIVHVIVGILFIAFFFLVKGIFDLTVAFVTREIFDLWWLQLIIGILEIVLAFWVAGAFQRSVVLLVAYVGIVALSRGITELFLAFKLKDVNKRIAAA
jgi:uncharacterized membrane protein HdeD (DUF308 family)